VTVAGLPTGETITLDWGTWTGVTLSNNTAIGNGTRAITITYNGTSAISTPTNTRTLTSTGGYTLSSNTVSVTIRDGQAEGARAIPVNNTNFQNFGTYARAAGRTRHYFLTQNVTLTGTNNWTPIGATNATADRFSGSFNGNGFIISGMNMNITTANSWAGMFGVLYTGGVVRNLHLTGVNITGTEYVGGIAGDLTGGTIENCRVEGNVTATRYYAGGIVGHFNSGTVRNCYTRGTVSGRTQSSEVGGIAGRLANAGVVENCYSTSAVSGLDVGGIVGYATQNSTIRNCVALNDAITGSARNRIVEQITTGVTLSNNHALDTLGPVQNVGANLRGGANVTAATRNTTAFWTSTLGWNSTTIWNIVANTLPTLRSPTQVTSAPIEFIIEIEEPEDGPEDEPDEEKPEEEPDEEKPEEEPDEEKPEEEPEEEPDEEPEEEPEEEEPEDEPEEEEPEEEPEEEKPEDEPEEEEPGKEPEDEPGKEPEDEHEVEEPDEDVDDTPPADEQAFTSLRAAAYSRTETDIPEYDRSFADWWQLLVFPVIGSIVIITIRSKGARRH